MKKTCEVCKNKIFKYVCPACEIVYCSLECYKNHNDSCVSNFLENQVNENIKNNEITEFDKKEFKYKLKKFYEENSQGYFLDEYKNVNKCKETKEKKKDDEDYGDDNESDDDINEEDDDDDDENEDEDDDDENEDEDDDDENEDEDDDNNCDEKKKNEIDECINDKVNKKVESNSNYLKKWCISKKRYKVLTELALKDELKLENLNKIEKKQFFSFLKNNDLSQYLERYEPWWLDCVIKKMDIPEHICCNKNVNKNIIFIIIEILYSYCYLLRIYNKYINKREFCYTLLYLANSLNRFYLPESNILNTINNLFQRILENDELVREKNVLYNVITDVTKILTLKELILRCLYETKKIFKKEIERINIKKSHLNNDINNTKQIIGSLQEQNLFKYVTKKIKFLYSYSNYHYENFDVINKQLTKFYNEQKKFVESNDKREIILSKEIT